MKKSRTVVHRTAVESPRHLPLVDLLVDARSELRARGPFGAEGVGNDAGRGSDDDLRSAVCARRRPSGLASWHGEQ
jgi:hypothetical protein